MASENELKTAFAMTLVREPGDPWKAAFAILPEDPTRAMHIANVWPADAFVISEIERLKESGSTAQVADKMEQAFDLYKMAKDEKLDAEVRIKAHELYAKIMGHIERPVVNNGIINNSNKVMVVRMPMNEHGEEMSEFELETTSALAQRTLKGN
jgi:hypothetical protein